MSQDFDMDYDYPVTVPAKRSHSSSANLNPRGGSHVGGRGRGRWGGQSRGRGGGQQRGGVRDNPTYWTSRNEHSVSALQSPPAHASPSAAAQTGTGSSTSPRIASGSRKGPAGRLSRAWVRSGVEPPPGDASVIQLTIMTYNVLCNDYVEAGFYPRCSRHDLHPDVRRANIVREMADISADIICMQEVDCFGRWAAALQPHGYKGIYQQRTGDKRDGCAVFFRQSMFEIAATETLELRRQPHEEPKDNVAQFVLLRHRSRSSAAPPRVFAVANVHMLYNPKRGDIKLGQFQFLLLSLHQWLTSVSSTIQEDAGRPSDSGALPVPVIVCGDFNATPDSVLAAFMREGCLRYSGLDRYSMDGQLQNGLHTGGMQDYIRPSNPSDRPSEEASACSACAPGSSKLLHIHQPAQDAHHRHAHRPGRHHGSRHFVNSHRANDVLPPGFATRAGQQHVLDDDQYIHQPFRFRQVFDSSWLAPRFRPSACHHRYKGMVDYIWYTECSSCSTLPAPVSPPVSVTGSDGADDRVHGGAPGCLAPVHCATDAAVVPITMDRRDAGCDVAGAISARTASPQPSANRATAVTAETKISDVSSSFRIAVAAILDFPTPPDTESSAAAPSEQQPRPPAAMMPDTAALSCSDSSAQFQSAHRHSPSGILDRQHLDQFMRSVEIPTSHHCSDHFPLAASLAITFDPAA